MYHGTSTEVLEKILNSGIKPRHKESQSNWEEFPSKPGYVYLTNAYALYFAISAIKNTDNLKCVIIEIETDYLRQNRLCPDEDFIGQVQSRQEGISIKEATNRCVPLDYRQYWKISVEKMGNCCYFGKIPVSAITRYAIIDLKINYILAAMGLDPTISILNFSLLSKKYISLIQHIFDGTEVYDERRLFTETVDMSSNSGTEFVNKMIKDSIEFAQKLQELRPKSITVFNVKDNL